MKSYGEYFGYPQCCIQAFHNFRKFVDLSKERQQATKHGFVPCQTCAEKVVQGKIKTEQLILPTRECPRPFIRIDDC